MPFKQIKSLWWPDLFTLIGLLCVSASIYCSFKHLFVAAYVLLICQIVFDYLDGKLARTIGGGMLGVYLDSFSDFLSVAASVVLGWFLGIHGLLMFIAGILNLAAAAIRLSYFTAKKEKVTKIYTGVPTVLAALIVSTIAITGYYLGKQHLHWLVIPYFLSAIAMVSDLKIKKVGI